MSTKSDWNSRLPSCGVIEDVAPRGEQSVNPALQVPATAREATELEVIAKSVE
jgi:hypothetical protein